MELSGKYCGRGGFLWLSFCIFLTLSCAKPEEPLTNVNLSPFWQWRSAYECLLNTSNPCGVNTLNMSGIIHVTGSEVTGYCSGCVPTIERALSCVSLVKRDFRFINNVTVKDINVTITQSCANNSDIIVPALKSSGMRNSSRTYVALFSAMVLAIFLFST